MIPEDVGAVAGLVLILLAAFATDDDIGTPSRKRFRRRAWEKMLREERDELARPTKPRASQAQYSDRR
jgi:hypothetical protein